MFTFSELKKQARNTISVSYWRSVLAAIVVSIGVGGLTDFVARCGGHWWTDLPWWGGYHIHEHGHGPFEFYAYGSGFPDSFGSFFPFVVRVAGAAFIAVVVFRILLRLFVFNPMEVGGRRYFIVNRAMNGTAPSGEMIQSFSRGYTNIVKTMFLRALYTFLWSLLFIVPGIVKTYSYRMVPYILAESPDMDQKEAFRLSRAMMDGYKWKAFLFDLSFIGWYLLDAMTFGILGIFYVDPYKDAADTEFYAAVRDTYLGRGAAADAGV